MELEDLSNFLNSTNNRELALQLLEVFAKRAVFFEEFDDISKCYFKIKEYSKSIEYGEKAYAIASRPEQMYNIRSNLINVYNHNNEPHKALRYIKANQDLIKNDIDMEFEKAFSLFLLNRKNEAAELLRSKIDSPFLDEEQRTKLFFNLGTYDMLDGNLLLGMERFLFFGEKMKIWNHATIFSQDNINSLGFTRWDGTITPGKNILIVAEAGIGDEIINMRFYKKIKDLGMNPIWMTLPYRKELIELYKANGIYAISTIEEIPFHFRDFVAVPAMHLPLFLRCEYKDLWDGPYITNTIEEYDKKWELLVPRSNKLNVGIRYQGNPEYDQDLHRSIPLKNLMESLSELDANFYNLQRDTGVDQLSEFPNIIDPIKESNNILDLVSYIKQLDIVVTSCTSVAHIALAMGKLTFVWVPISCYYVWCNPTKKSPWYGNNCHVLYQEKPKNWQNCIAEQKELVRNLINNSKTNSMENLWHNQHQEMS